MDEGEPGRIGSYLRSVCATFTCIALLVLVAGTWAGTWAGTNDGWNVSLDGIAAALGFAAAVSALWHGCFRSRLLGRTHPAVRIVASAIPSFLLAALFAAGLGWLPADTSGVWVGVVQTWASNAWAWGRATLLFLAALGIVCAIVELRRRHVDRRFDERLDEYKRHRNKRHD